MNKLIVPLDPSGAQRCEQNRDAENRKPRAADEDRRDWAEH
jgi:hypothetical protein